MADGRSQNGKNKPNKNIWKKGEVHNPAGSSARARKLAHIKRLTIDELAEVGSAILRNNREDLARIRDDEDTSTLQFWIMSLVNQSIKKGDVEAFDTLMTRLIGKPPETPVSRLTLEMEARQEDGGF